MDTSITRSRSNLVSIQEQSEESEHTITQSPMKQLIRSFILMSAIMGGSSIGVMNNYIPVESPFAKNAWRNGLVCVYFIIPAIIENLWVKATFKLTLESYLRILFTMFMQVFWVFGLTYASSRTIQSHAYLINNVHGLFMVVLNYFLGQKVLRGEFKGMLFAMVGCIIILSDPQALRKEEFQSSPLIPNIINLMSAFFGALYFLLNAQNVNSMPIISLVLF